ncbi:MAG: macro domain-containing protein [Candidatus Acidiferrales bacterium]
MNIRTIAVLGAGAEGRVLAAAALVAGYRVVLEDFRADFLRDAISAVRRAVEETALQGPPALSPEQITSRLCAARTVEDACREGAELILDLTTDELELKLEIFTLLDKFAFPGAICATNAASIPIAELGAMTYRPELCIGVRLAQRDARPMLEVLRSRRTLDSAVAACCEFAQRLGWESSVRAESAPSQPGSSTGAGESALGRSAIMGAAMGLADKIVLQQGDITDLDVDAIVNAANNDLQLGGGVAGAIRRKGGDSIQRECDEIGSIPIGGAAITRGGKLKSRHVIHAATMALGGQTTARALRGSTAHCLRIAHEHGLRTIAFPAVGTGIAGFPLSECAAIMLHEVAKHLCAATSLETVYFVLFDDRALRAFQNEFAAMKARGEFGEAGAIAPL